EPWAAALGASLVRTLDPLRTLHTAVLTDGPLPERTGAAFEQHLVRTHAGQDFLDLVSAARVFGKLDEPTRAIRFLRRAIEMDPANPELHLLMASALGDT